MRPLTLACLFSIFAFSALAYADEQRWQEELPNTLQLKGGLATPSLDLTLTGPGADIVFVPNSPANLMLGFSYKSVGLSFQIPSAPEPDSITKKGKTRIEDFQFRFFGHRSTHELIYQKFRGYSLQDWKSPGGSPVIRPDLTTRVININFIRSLSPRFFSDAVAYDQRGVQFRQGGAIFVWSAAGQMSIEGDEELVPSFVLNGRSQIANLERVKIHYALAGLGYGHQFPIFTRGYFVASIFLGGGVNYQELGLNGQQEDHFTGAHRTGLRTGLGYNFGDYTAGFQLIVDSSTATVLDGALQTSTLTTKLFFGHRFQGVSIPALDF